MANADARPSIGVPSLRRYVICRSCTDPWAVVSRISCSAARDRIALANVVRLKVLFAVNPHMRISAGFASSILPSVVEKNTPALSDSTNCVKRISDSCCSVTSRAHPITSVTPARLRYRLKPAVEVTDGRILLEFDGNDSRPRAVLRERGERPPGFLERGRFDELGQGVADKVLKEDADDFG